MNPPPLDMKQAQECLCGAQQQLQACIELRRAASMRIKTLEDMLAFDKHSWQFHEPSYAALCLAEQRISFGKFCEYMRGLRDGKTDPIVQGVTPSMESQIAERIQELEAENAALREKVSQQGKREATWAKRFDQQVGSFAARLYNSRKRRIVIARRRISALRAELAALREDKARLDWLGKTGGIKETGLLKTQWIIYRYPLNEQQRYDDIRDAIDAARKEPPDASV